MSRRDGVTEDEVPRRPLMVALIAAVAAVVVIAAAAAVTSYLVRPQSPASQTQTAQPTPPPEQSAQPASPAAEPTAQPAPPATQTPQPAALVPFVGRWSRHGEALVIDSTGTGSLTYPDVRLCPTCSNADAPEGTLAFTLTSVSNGVATGSVTASSDAQGGAVGDPVTATIVPGFQGKGVNLQLTIDGKQLLPWCNSTSAGQCGA
jgi:hypothetical protein